MMGDANPQRAFFYHISLETFVPDNHPLRRIRPLIDDRGIRRACRDLYSPIGRPSIPPEQLFLALVGGYLLGVTSDRKLVMELQCHMALRWFVGLNLDEQPWDASTFSQNRRRRFDESGILERLFDETVAKAMMEGLVSRHVSADGTLVRANASFKSFVPIEVAMAPEEYKSRLRSEDRDAPSGPDDPGNRAVNFRGEKRSNATHRSLTDPDCRYVSKGASGTGAYPGYAVTALMENRHRILLGLEPGVFRSVASETSGCLTLLEKARACWATDRRRSGPTRGSSLPRSSTACWPGTSNRTSRQMPADVSWPTREFGCGCAASDISSRNGAGRRLRSCSGRPRTGMGFAASDGEASTAYVRRAI